VIETLCIINQEITGLMYETSIVYNPLLFCAGMIPLYLKPAPLWQIVGLTLRMKAISRSSALLI